MDPAGFAVQVQADQAAFLGIAFHHENAIIAGTELQVAAILGDPGHGPAGRRDAVDAGFGRGTRAGQVTAAILLKDHGLAIG